MKPDPLYIIEAALMVAGRPLSVEQLRHVFEEDDRPTAERVRELLTQIEDAYATRAVSLKRLASGFCFQTDVPLSPWLRRLWETRAPRYSNATLETLSLIAYRQPVTRGDIEAVRGVPVSTQIIKTLEAREWIKVMGHRDVPGKPALYGTTKAFLDYFNLCSLTELPALPDIQAREAEWPMPSPIAPASEDNTIAKK